MKKILIGMVLVIGLMTSYTNLYGEQLIRVKALFWNSDLEGDVTASTKLLAGTKLSLSRTLDLDQKAYIPEIDLRINLLLMGKLIGSYWQANYEGEKTLVQNINFGGHTFSAHELVQTDLALSMGTLLYEMTFVPEHLDKIFPSITEVESGLLLGVKYFQTETSLTSSRLGQVTKNFGVPIPVMGLFWQAGFLDKIKVETALTFFSATVSDITARLLDFYAEVKMNIGPLPVGLGYKITDLNFEDESSNTLKANLGLKGLYFTASFEF